MGSRKKVLIAEDYADTRLMTRILLESIGFEVIEARDGAEAIVQAQRTHPDLVLMDIAMPVLNGITAATMIHQLESCEDIPIIALTAFGREYVEKASDYGFDAVIEKPVDMDDLVMVLQERLNPNSAAGAQAH
jgi:CheY-like chemotaxis protein